MTTPKSILIYGSAEFGKVVNELAVACGYTFEGYIDDWNAGSEILGPLTRVQFSHDPSEYYVALAIGYKHLLTRRQVADSLQELGYKLASLVHPEAYVAPSAVIDAGAMVMARASVDIRTHIGALTVVWTGATVSHDCDIVGNSFISPGATVCGHTRIGEGSFLGAGSIVVDHVDLPDGSFVRAGEVYKGPHPSAGTSE